MFSKWIKILVQIVFILTIILTGINLLLNVHLTKSINLKGETNDFCQHLNITEQKNSLDYLACDNKFKKKKIILLFLDSLPFDKLYELTNRDISRIPNFFRGKGLDYKQSGALFETIFTGKFSSNYLASITKIGTLAQQFKNANMDVYYKIKYFPLTQLINHNLFTKLEVHEGELIPLSLFCEGDRNIFEKYYEETNNYFVDTSTSNFKKDLSEKILYKRSHEKLDEQFDLMRQNYKNVSQIITSI